jgi:hypothetical protein
MYIDTEIQSNDSHRLRIHLRLWRSIDTFRLLDEKMLGTVNYYHGMFILFRRDYRNTIEALESHIC